MPTCELILVNLGTPTAPTPEAVRAFLAEFLSDPLVVEKSRWIWLPILHGIILRRRPAKVAVAYQEIWTDSGSPLAAGTGLLTSAVNQATGPNTAVTHAYRYGPTNLKSRLLESLAKHPGSNHPILVVPLFPQRTASSSGTIAKLTGKLAAELGLQSRLQLTPISPIDPNYIEALCAPIRQALAQQPPAPATQLVASFHGIPEAVNTKESGRYMADCQATFDAMLDLLEHPPEHAILCFQSRFGRDPWLTPDTEQTLIELGARGQPVVVCTPGFLTAGLETIEELGLRARAAYSAAGGPSFTLADCPVTYSPQPALVRAIVNLAK